MPHNNKKGLFPGPGETEEAFQERIGLICPREDLSDWAGAHKHTSALFDIAPDWIETRYSNKKLAFWEAAATWIDGKKPPVIQLKTALQKGSYLFTTREEILAHESVHAARAGFKGARFEELLAYATSSKQWRRLIGPFFQRPWEATLFLSLCIPAFLGIYFPLVIGTAYGIARLIWIHYLFQNCVLNLKPLTSKPLAVALRLSDREITAFATLPSSQIAAYAANQTEPRWRVIQDHYFTKIS